MPTTKFEDWPEKQTVLPYLLGAWNSLPQNLNETARQLFQMGKDEKTHRIGETMILILAAGNTNRRFPHIYKLLELLPTMDDYDVRAIFRCFFISFTRPGTNDSASMCCMNFYQPPVILYEDLVIGTEPSRGSSTEFTVCAFNRISERLEWDISFPEQPCYLKNTSLGLAVLFSRSSLLSLYNPVNGSLIANIQLPGEAPDRDFMHITPSGFFYYTNMGENCTRNVYGGRIVDGTLNMKSIKVVEFSGEFKPFGEFLLLDDLEQERCIIIDQTGSQVCLENIHSIFLHKEAVYTIEQDRRVIIKRTVVAYPRLMIGPPRKVGFLENKKWELAAMGGEDMLLCVAPSRLDEGSLVICFFDLATHNVSPVENGPRGQNSYFIDKENSAVYFFNPSYIDSSPMLYQYTPDKVRALGRNPGMLHPTIAGIKNGEIYCYQNITCSGL